MTILNTCQTCGHTSPTCTYEHAIHAVHSLSDTERTVLSTLHLSASSEESLTLIKEQFPLMAEALASPRLCVVHADFVIRHLSPADKQRFIAAYSDGGALDVLTTGGI